MLFAQNIKYLRKRKKRSQEEAALALGIKRTSLSGYESGNNEPPIHKLLHFADYFEIPIDVLLRTDISQLSEQKLGEIERSYYNDVVGRSLRVLATTVGPDNIENIELVPEKAKAGYATGYSDPEFISELNRFRIPFLDPNKKYRAFQISGDSMLPVKEGSWITAEFVQNWMLLKSGTPCIVVTQQEGIVFKIVHNYIEQENCLLLESLNSLYEPYKVAIADVVEIWQFVHVLSAELPEPSLSPEEVIQSIVQLQKEVKQLKMSMNSSNSSN